jgi:hypothetical protein
MKNNLVMSLIMMSATAAYFAKPPIKWIGPLVTGTFCIVSFVAWVSR